MIIVKRFHYFKEMLINSLIDTRILNYTKGKLKYVIDKAIVYYLFLKPERKKTRLVMYIFCSKIRRFNVF